MDVAVLRALQIVSLSLTAIAQFQSVAQRANDLIGKARTDGRQISDEELSALEAESKALEAEVFALLKTAAQPQTGQQS